MVLPPFQTLLDAHGRDVHRLLVATVGAQAADDCYQETWLAALAAYPRLRTNGNLRAWILTIAHHKAMDHHRARVRAPAALEAMVGDGEGTAAAAAAQEATGGDPQVTAAAIPDDGLWAQVAALPAKQRGAVALRFIADAPYADIARAMGTSEPAARRNVHEALKRLRQDVTR